MYRCIADARLDVTRTGQVIMDEGLPRQLGPLIFVIVGDGNVSKGALHIFKCLPHEWIAPDQLAALASSTTFDNHKVYICQIKAQDYIVNKDSNLAFQTDRYYKHPEEFKSVFHTKIAPYARFILNGIFWTEKYPRLMTIEQTKQLALENNLRLLTLADVSCDINGSFEFMGKSSTIDDPFYMYDPITGEMHDDVEKQGIQIMSIDNLPTEMPLEASEYFSDALIPIISEMARGNLNHPIIERATVANDGKLVAKHQGLAKIVEKYGSPTVSATHKKKVLLLGSGFVAKPLVDYLLRDKNIMVTIASNDNDEAAALSRGQKNTLLAPLNVSDSVALGALVQNHHIVVSFVPATLHPLVAEQCLTFKKNLVTASYISPAMNAYHERYI